MGGIAVVGIGITVGANAVVATGEVVEDRVGRVDGGPSVRAGRGRKW